MLHIKHIWIAAPHDLSSDIAVLKKKLLPILDTHPSQGNDKPLLPQKLF